MPIKKLITVVILCSVSVWSQTTSQEPEVSPEAEEIAIVPVSAKEADDAQLPVFSNRNPRYLLRAGDILELTFTFTPELNQKVPVHPDGFIALREVGDLHVGGMDLPRVRAALAGAYAKILRDPAIHVELIEFERPYFVAGGQLKSPGKYEMRGDVTVSEAVAVAGGFTDAAKHSQVLIFRRLAEDRVEIRKLDVKKILTGKGVVEDIHLRPGDMIYVPQSMLSKLKGFVLPRMTVGPTIR